jgi:hypothetical protein
MATAVTRMLLVVVTALTLAVGALSATGGLGSSWGPVEVSSGTNGWAQGDYRR